MRRLLLAGLILVLEFVCIEAALRAYGRSEASPEFQALFMQDPKVGYRLKPNAHARYTTAEFTSDIDINAQGVRDDDPIGPKAPGERRIVFLGDSLLLSVQVEQHDTFCHLLETALNRAHPERQWRVINAGVQGYGPVDEWLLYRNVAEQFEPDLVMIQTFVAKAPDVVPKAPLLDGVPPAQARGLSALGIRRLVRSSVTLQIVRQRYDQLKSRFVTKTPESPLATYLATPPPVVAQGIELTRRAIGLIAARAAERGARTAVMLMPARFQTDDFDFGQLTAAVNASGGTLVRNAGTERYQASLSTLGLPMLDVLPTLSAQPDRVGLFFQRNVHLTERGHRVVAGALEQFLETSGLLAAIAR